MTESLVRFQSLIGELFQFDCADLDFGIYRILNQKRDAIVKFVSVDLPKGVEDALKHGALASHSALQHELDDTVNQIQDNFGANALDAYGDLAEAFRATPIGQRYVEIKAKVGALGDDSTIRAAVFNHLYSFFSRYYEDGDFIAKRRYSRRNKYAIPYNGEEVYFYWVNNDQYYIKNVDRLTDYRYVAPNGTKVLFKLSTAKIQQNDLKVEKRVFLPLENELSWDEKADQLTVPFEYRSLIGSEQKKYGKTKQQEAIIERTVSSLPSRLSVKTNQRAIAALTARAGADGETTLLEHHLRQFTRASAADFFIHKDLRRFLSLELDFYLKNEVFDVDELGGDQGQALYEVAKIIKRIGSQVIEFLHQFEDFQKMLWEKRKFVLETNYCVALGRVPKHLLGAIVSCEPQWNEWKENFFLDRGERRLFSGAKSKIEGARLEFLQNNASLMIDSRHFSQQFVDDLLAAESDLDGAIDGWILHAENWQGLNLVSRRFTNLIKAAYYDPPYNTSEETFVYKNNYQHSSWLAMMRDRVSPLGSMLTDDGAVMIAIDDAELYHLKLAMDEVLGASNYVGTIVVQSNPRGRGISTHFATSHDYYVVYAGDAGNLAIVDQPLTEEQAQEYRHADGDSSYRLLPFRRSGGLSTPRERPNSEFTLYYSETAGRIVAVGGESISEYPAEYKPKYILSALDGSATISQVTPAAFKKAAPSDVIEIRPLDKAGSRRVWRWSDREKILQAAMSGDFVVRTEGRVSVLLKDREKAGRKPKTVWYDSKYDASSHGTNLLKDIVGARGRFVYPKSLYSTMDALHCIVGDDESAVVLDAFAGSGTTGHAVISLNRQDGGSRKFLLIDMGQHFDDVLLQRIKKVAYAPEWSEGKPKRFVTAEERDRSPRIIKYQRLESYEDALDNIVFADSAAQGSLQFEDYLLRYQLSWESRESETLLDVQKLERPFQYTLRSYANGEIKSHTVDLLETFNYLIGLNVSARQVYCDEGRRYVVYIGDANGRPTVVVWRDTGGWEETQFKRDHVFIIGLNIIKDGMDVFVNGDSFVAGAKSIDSVFKRLMFATERR